MQVAPDLDPHQQLPGVEDTAIGVGHAALQLCQVRHLAVRDLLFDGERQIRLQQPGRRLLPGQIEQAGLDAAGDQDAARLALLAAHDAAGKAVENLRRVRLRIRHDELRRLLLAQPLLGQQL